VLNKLLVFHFLSPYVKTAFCNYTHAVGKAVFGVIAVKPLMSANLLFTGYVAEVQLIVAPKG